MYFTFTDRHKQACATCSTLSTWMCVWNVDIECGCYVTLCYMLLYMITSVSTVIFVTVVNTLPIMFAICVDRDWANWLVSACLCSYTCHAHDNDDIICTCQRQCR